MSRESKLYIDDMLDAIERIETYTKDMDFDEFEENRMAADAVIRNLLVIGEAAKKIPAEVQKSKPDVEWKKMAGLRDILVHEYFGIDLRIVWDVVKNKLPDLKEAIKSMET